MNNPWFEVTLAEYEGHMSAPAVGQLAVLSELFGEVLAERRPLSVAVLGVAGGNGLERIDGQRVVRVAGFDCHAGYLEVVRERFAGLAGLEVHCVDLAEQWVEAEPFDLVHAALIFEHAGTERCLQNAVRLVEPGGALSVVLQLPSEATAAVAPTGITSIALLGAHFAFVDPGALQRRLAGMGFWMTRAGCRELPGGKNFWSGIFERRGAEPPRL